MKARLLLFAAAREATGSRVVEVEAGSVGEALEAAALRCGPSLGNLLPSCAIFVDEVAVAPHLIWETPVAAGTEIAVLPPVSGGQHAGEGHGHRMSADGSGDSAGTSTIRVAVLTVSDRSARGERVDQAGPAVQRAARIAGWVVTAAATVPDEAGRIETALRAWSDRSLADLVLTTGGTGLGPRDLTPEATRAVLDREVPGLPEVMRQAGMSATPFAALSRQVAGQRGRTLIVNLPGSPRAAVECLRSVMTILPHAVELTREVTAP